MEITLKLGSKITVSVKLQSRLASLMYVLQESDALRRRLEAVSTTMKAALSSMDTKEGMMRNLETGTKYLRLLISLGKDAAEVRLRSLFFPFLPSSVLQLNEKAKVVSGLVESMFKV